ncbi:transmembrane protein, putative [Medicago truncatula]|uniref:Transmembrane protein, putative n=1 Tax=Medicago truncatula TaxID=3880 RepID=G7L800_MEDTR|nr:transmembrane protein, putative [Medicago truncatula]
MNNSSTDVRYKTNSGHIFLLIPFSYIWLRLSVDQRFTQYSIFLREEVTTIACNQVSHGFVLHGTIALATHRRFVASYCDRLMA